MNKQSSLSYLIADFIVNPPSFTSEAIYLAKRSILDTIGAMIIGSETETFRMACLAHDILGNCTVLGKGQIAIPGHAAFLNGISGHELELDDTSSSNLGHPSVSVLPALLALCEELHCKGEELLKSYLISTEVTCKIGKICAKQLHEKGWHASSITGVLGAAAGCAYLRNLDREGCAHAIGIAASMASGIRENFGTSTKSMHIGKCAEDGYRAATLAAKGFSSSEISLEGNEGYLYEYAGIRDSMSYSRKIIKSLGKDWDIVYPGFTIKRHPSCSSSHRAVDALMELIQENGITMASIDFINIGLSKTSLRELVCPYPENGDEAKFSIGFQIALFLAGLENHPNNYNKSIIRKPEIQNIIYRTRMYEEEKYNDLPSEKGSGPAHVTIVTKDRKEFSKEREFPIGHKSDPISEKELKDKFLRCVLGVLGDEKARKLYEKLYRLETIEDIQLFLRYTYR